MKLKQQKFTELLNDNQGLIIKISRMYTNSLEDEEDLVQEIVLQLWRSYDSYKGDSKFSSWMYRVALNTAITIFRKESRSPKNDDVDDYNFISFEPNDDEKENEENDKFLLLKKVIKMLPKLDRAIVMMYLDDLSYREIADTLGITEGNARVKMNRLKKTLKDLMLKHG